MASTYCPECDALTLTTTIKCAVCGTKRPVEGWPVDPLVGTVFADSYTVMKRLGRGGFGVVYLAENQEFGGKRALKVLHGQHIHNDSVLGRFKREAKALYRLQSPYTVRMERWGRSDEGQYYMVMELAEGDTLRRLMDLEGRLDEDRALHIARQIAVALADAHALDILHRDLKPENIVIRSHTYEGDRIAVLDFGIAKILTDESDSRISGLVGTPSYMAPENWRPALGKADIRSDLWSLGVILFEMLAGSLPFGSRTSPDPMAAAMEACQLKPAAIARALSAIPVHPLTQQIIIRLLQPVPDNRYASPAELLAVMDGHPVLHNQQMYEPAGPPLASGGDKTPRPVGLTGSESGRSKASRGIDLAGSRTGGGKAPGAVGLADTLSPAAELAQSQGPDTPDEEFTFDEAPEDAFSFGDEPPEGIQLRKGQASPEDLPFSPKPTHRLRTLAIALCLLGAIALLARYGDRLLDVRVDEPADAGSENPAGEGDLADLPGETATLATLNGSDGMALHPVEAGRFLMGSDEIESAGPGHDVQLGTFYLDEREVTRAMWQRCVQRGHCPGDQASYAPEIEGCAPLQPDPSTADQPMTCISWQGAQAYCEAVGRRLPTEAEWERAARGPDQALWPAWVDAARERYRAPREDEDRSAFGPADMGGGVREWVADWYAEAYYSASPYLDPRGPFAGVLRGVRGASTQAGRPVAWVSRGREDPSSRLPDLGFRCAMDPL